MAWSWCKIISHSARSWAPLRSLVLLLLYTPARTTMADLFCRALCCQPFERPLHARRDSAPLDRRVQREMGSGVRIQAILFTWSFSYLIVTVMRRRVLGIILNLLGSLSATTGVYGILALDYRIILISMFFQANLVWAETAWVLTTYFTSVRAEDAYAWTILALYLPDVILDAVSFLCIIPFYCRIRKIMPPLSAPPSASTAPARIPSGDGGAARVVHAGVTEGVPVAPHVPVTVGQRVEGAV